jgi:hypothetical protein
MNNDHNSQFSFLKRKKNQCFNEKKNKLPVNNINFIDRFYSSQHIADSRS